MYSKENTMPNILSRLPRRNIEETQEEYFEILGEVCFFYFLEERHHWETMIWHHQDHQITGRSGISEGESQSKEYKAFGTTLWGIMYFHYGLQIYLPIILREELIAWYHETLQHLGMNTTFGTIQQHLG